MASRTTIADKILEAVRNGEGEDLDTLTRNLPELTWNQVFSEIDRMSRTGQILVTCQPGGRYSLQMPRSDSHPT